MIIRRNDLGSSVGYTVMIFLKFIIYFEGCTCEGASRRRKEKHSVAVEHSFHFPNIFFFSELSSGICSSAFYTKIYIIMIHFPDNEVLKGISVVNIGFNWQSNWPYSTESFGPGELTNTKCIYQDIEGTGNDRFHCLRASNKVISCVYWDRSILGSSYF